MSYLPGKFVWFEHVSSDTAKARKFYDPLFNWHTESMPMGSTRYPMIMNGNDGIGGDVGDPPGPPALLLRGLPRGGALWAAPAPRAAGGGPPPGPPGAPPAGAATH